MDIWLSLLQWYNWMWLFFCFNSDVLAHFNRTRNKNGTFASSLIENSPRTNSNKKWFDCATRAVEFRWQTSGRQCFFFFLSGFLFTYEKNGIEKKQKQYIFTSIDLIFIHAQMDEPWVCTYTHVAANINVDE